MGFVRVKEQ